MTPGVWRDFGIFLGLLFLAAGFWWVAWRLSAASRRALAEQRATAHRVGLDRYTPQTQDRFGDDWTRRHRGWL